MSFTTSRAAILPVGLAGLMLAAATLSAMAQTPVPKRDRSFAEKAAAANMGEIAEARMALQKSKVPGIDQFAQRMVHDHTAAGMKLKKIAVAESVSLPSAPSAHDRRQAGHLMKLEGAAFERAYVKDQVAAHKKAVSLFQHESERGRDPQLKGFATDTLPTLEEHLQMAETLEKSMEK
jgi:putative membrane protein